MLLKHLKLKNIRSYQQQELYFPEGSVLLSGDIGAGKTTILLAIEFALFGFMKGDVTGSTLLRHGAKEGFIELCFSLEGKEIIIQRYLKKNGATIAQSAGSILINGMSKDATAIELKSDILTLMGYPGELLTKSKSLMYRYTVYTPQEEMKMILFEDAEARLDTLRKLFGIDKYKRVQENCSKYLKELREKQKLFFGEMQGLDEKEKQSVERKNIIKKSLEDLEHQKKLFEQHQQVLLAQKQQLKVMEEKLERYHDAKLALARSEEKLAFLLQQRIVRQQRVIELKKHIDEIPPEMSPKDPELIEQEIAQCDQHVQNLHQDIQQHKISLGMQQAKINAAKDIINQVAQLDHCPLCLQNVSHVHKNDVVTQQKNLVHTAEQALEQEHIVIQTIEKEILNKKQILQEKRIHLQQVAMQRMQHLRVIEKKQEALQIEKELLLDQQRVAEINKEKLLLQTELFNGAKVHEEYLVLKKEYEKNAEGERKLIVGVTQLEESSRTQEILLRELEKDLEKKRKAKQQYEQLRDLHQWLSGYFIPLIETMERHVMTKIYHDFNQLFQKWFLLLVEDEMLQTRLDATFTPIVIQNGYETGLSNLSGGEKTSCALAYRLALNKVVNDLIHTIKTKDLIILDEPTDGFSSTQIEKIGEVIEELNMQQILIVSHEPKIEAFVDHVIKIEKQGHVSSIQ